MPTKNSFRPARYRIPLLVFLGSILWASANAAQHSQPTVPTADFSQDILPLLANHCFPCHGPDQEQRKANLRLDIETGSRADLGGYAAVAPGDPNASELIKRIFATDPADVMPPPETKHSLTEEEKAQLRQWVLEGARYEAHWAWEAPERPAVPSSNGATDWGRNPIDHFILRRLNATALAPAPEADPYTLIRRVSLDLTGLPPSPEDVDRFVNDDSDNAYEQLVERLLHSPHYGERMAVDWLDAARYADTNGYQVDRNREMYAWRDWVIKAFNENKPFDVFTVEQLAGDLLPKPSLDQQIATGFHRNHMMNEEGGVIPEEFLAEYCADRVETTATIWLGQTFTCARCHDHKFDPFTQKDYYSLVAFFHNIEELGRGNYGANIRRNNPPMLQLPTPDLEAARDQARTRLDAAEQKIQGLTKDSPQHEELTKQIAALKKEFDQADLAIPTTLVMKERSEPRPTFILMRGAYDKPGEQVHAATPASLPPMNDKLPKNRLGLARWLVDPGHPLTARVTVNRLWQSLFGQGLVTTPEDFGTQGKPPSHPELLDWLAIELVENGWDIKALIRQIVTSATYRQTSRVSPALLEQDPENRFLARGPRFRLQAEFLRDQALAASGLFVPAIGGPSVRPYHPPGLYEQVVAGKGEKTYRQDQGEKLFRRSMYSYWKRSVPQPAMLTFDAPFRETCTVNRSRTNTPMQALNLMNDTTYVEAAKFLARRMIREGGSGMDSRLIRGFRIVTARPPTPPELIQLRATTQRSLTEFGRAPAEAEALLSVGDAIHDDAPNAAEWAAYTITASLLLNLDEAITRE